MFSKRIGPCTEKRSGRGTAAAARPQQAAHARGKWKLRIPQENIPNGKLTPSDKHGVLPAHQQGNQMRIRGTCARLVLAAATLAAIPIVAMASETISYTYDAKGRLTKVARSGTVNNGVTSNYTHDKADNRTNVTVTGSAVTGTASVSPPLDPETSLADDEAQATSAEGVQVGAGGSGDGTTDPPPER
jgi:hypothetical protein